LAARIQVPDEYPDFIGSIKDIERLCEVPSIEHWDISKADKDKIVSLGFVKFCNPFEPISKIEFPTEYSVRLRNPSLKIFLSFPVQCGFDAFKKELVAIKKKSNIYYWYRMANINQLTLVNESYTQTESDKSTLDYWRKYFEKPYDGHKKVLFTTPLTTAQLNSMPPEALREHITLLKIKESITANTSTVTLFNTPDLKGIIVYYVPYNLGDSQIETYDADYGLLTKESGRIDVVIWMEKLKIRQLISIHYYEPIPMESIKQVITTLNYDSKYLDVPFNESLNKIRKDILKLPSFVSDTESLFRSLHYGHYQDDTIWKLIQKMQDVNSKSFYIDDGVDYFVFFPLHMAAIKNRIDFAELLIKKGADLNVRTEYSETPLLIAARNNNIKMIKFLLKHGANANSNDLFGFTPLALSKSNEATNILLPHTDNKDFSDPNAWPVTCDQAQEIAENLIQSNVSGDIQLTKHIRINEIERYYAFIYLIDPDMSEMPMGMPCMFGIPGFPIGYWIKVSAINGKSEFDGIMPTLLP